MAERTPTRQPSTSSRRSSIRPSNPDVFSDDYALEAIAVSDGFRPNVVGSTTVPPTSTTVRSIPRRPVPSEPRPDPPSDSPRRKKSSKRYGAGTSVSSRHATPAWPVPQRTPSMASVSTMSDGMFSSHRQTSTISSFSVPRIPSPYQGATGPSHPYAMYPQDTILNRTSTISSIRPPERSYNGPNGPMHPYGMYPQNTLLEPETSPATAIVPIAPVGFPGLGQHYTRRLGPDGEEADDIIGPDGHTEQLPPYTKYPDTAVTKERYAPDAPDSEESSASPLTRAETPAVQGLVDEGQASDDDNVEINVAAAGAAGQPIWRGTARQRWTRRSKKRTCCGTVPRWAVILIVVLAVLLAVVLGGVIGKWVSQSHNNHAGGGQGQSHGDGGGAYSSPDTSPESASTVTVTAIADATPLASPPANLPMLPKGYFGVPLGPPTDVSTSCTSETVTWQCVFDVYLGMNVLPADYDTTQVAINSTVHSDYPFYYGPQVPTLQGQTSLQLVNDTNDPGRGPAYFFQQIFNKIVVLPETFSQAPGKRAASEAVTESFVSERQSYDYQNRFPPVEPGQKPWFCFWNGTILEGFIYVTENISSSHTNTTNMVQSLLSSAIASPTASSATPSSSYYANSREHHDRRDSDWPAAMPTIYPNVVKIEERRNVTNAVQPYCQQMQILDDLSVVPLPNTTSSVTRVMIDEDESPVQRRSLADSTDQMDVRWRHRRRDSAHLGYDSTFTQQFRRRLDVESLVLISRLNKELVWVMVGTGSSFLT
ncbi:hypothetical protein MMC17_009774 [Xylographa soralifera]|nr:hypothetical protein [Xylographa soralifera]